MDKITNNQIKKTNRHNIYFAIYKGGRVSKQHLASALDLSMPTVTNNLKKLESANLITRDGFFDSTEFGGRKAFAIRCRETARIGIGVEILKEKVYIIAVDLYGNPRESDTLVVKYQNNDLYFLALGNWINSFIAQLPYPPESILGVGITLQGIVSVDKSRVLYAKLIDCNDLTLEKFSSIIKKPCMFFHDSEAAAYTEIWLNENVQDALYLWLNNNLGSAMIIDGKIHTGRGALSGTIEHMRVKSDGKTCYCGQKGCLETYASVDALRETAGEDLDVFFEEMRKGDARREAMWHQYLDYLAHAVNNVLMIIDCDIIFSGALRPHLNHSDLDYMKEVILRDMAFPFYTPRLSLGVSDQYAAAIGAALFQVNDFLQNASIFNVT